MVAAGNAFYGLGFMVALNPRAAPRSAFLSQPCSMFGGFILLDKRKLVGHQECVDIIGPWIGAGSDKIFLRIPLAV